MVRVSPQPACFPMTNCRTYFPHHWINPLASCFPCEGETQREKGTVKVGVARVNSRGLCVCGQLTVDCCVYMWCVCVCGLPCICVCVSMYTYLHLIFCNCRQQFPSCAFMVRVSPQPACLPMTNCRTYFPHHWINPLAFVFLVRGRDTAGERDRKAGVARVNSRGLPMHGQLTGTVHVHVESECKRVTMHGQLTRTVDVHVESECKRVNMYDQLTRTVDVHVESECKRVTMHGQLTRTVDVHVESECKRV